MSAGPPPPPAPELRAIGPGSRAGLVRQALEGIAIVVAAALAMIVVGWLMATLVAWLV